MNNLKNLTVFTFICEIMDAVVQAPSFKFRFNLMVVLFILITTTIVSYIYYSTTNHIVETAFEINDATGLMEEIFNSGVTDVLKELPLGMSFN